MTRLDRRTVHNTTRVLSTNPYANSGPSGVGSQIVDDLGPIGPLDPRTARAAMLAVAAHARGVADCRHLLDVLGLLTETEPADGH